MRAKFLQAGEGVANDATASERGPGRLLPMAGASAYVLSPPRALNVRRRLGPARWSLTEGLVCWFECLYVVYRKMAYSSFKRVL